MARLAQHLVVTTDAPVSAERPGIGLVFFRLHRQFPIRLRLYPTRDGAKRRTGLWDLRCHVSATALFIKNLLSALGADRNVSDKRLG